MPKKPALSKSPAFAALMALAPAAMPLLGKLWENKDVQAQITQLLSRLSKNESASDEAMSETVAVLRDQVQDLAESADDESEEHRAAALSRKLDACEKAIALLRAPGTSKKQRRTVRKKLDALREEILAAHLAELEDDLQQGRDPKMPRTWGRRRA